MRSTIATNLSNPGLFVAILMVAASLWPVRASQGLVYSVQKEGGPQSYLIGTMHSEDERVTSLLEGFARLIGEVEVVVVEMVPDAVTMLAIGAATLLPANQSLRRLVGEDRFGALSEAASQIGLSPDMLNRLKPWAAAVTLGTPVSRTGRFLDMEIYLQALQLQKRVVGLETAAEQLAVFDRMAPEVQLVLLEEMIKNASQMPKQLEELTEVYLAGDLERINRFAREQYAGMPDSIMRWFDEQLLDRRNIRMLDRLPGLMKGKRVLVAVGAMHLAGDTGLVAGLRRLGYRVERRH